MPRKLKALKNVPGITIPKADGYELDEINIDIGQGSVHVFWVATESQPNVDVIVPNPAFIDVDTTPDEDETVTESQPVEPVQVHREGVRFTGDDFAALAATPTLPGETLFAAIQRASYARLEAEGKFPSLGVGDKDE